MNGLFTRFFVLFCGVSTACFSCFSLVSKHEKSFLSQKIVASETFRVFIARDRYVVKQVQHHDRIGRREDENGDKEKSAFFKQEHDKINFKDLMIEGTLIVDVNWAGQAVNIRYKRGRTPRTWQAGKHFIQDVSRFRFTFPDKDRKIFRFEVHYFWSIISGTGFVFLTRKQRAIEYLRSQKKQ